MIRVTDVHLAGPAAASPSEVPNRIGSAEVPVRVYEPDEAALPPTVIVNVRTAEVSSPPLAVPPLSRATT